MDYFLILIAGFGGGVIRGIVGFVKHHYSYKNVKFELPHFFGMAFLSGIIGVLVTLAVKELGFVFLGSFASCIHLLSFQKPLQ